MPRGGIFANDLLSSPVTFLGFPKVVDLFCAASRYEDGMYEVCYFTTDVSCIIDVSVDMSSEF